MATRLDFQLGGGKAESRKRRSETDPLRILVIADLRAAARQETEALASARLLKLGIDNFDRVLGSLAPELSLAAPGLEGGMQLRFRALEDFHPDALFDALDTLSVLRSSRERLRDPKTFQDEKTRLLSAAGTPAQAATVSGPVEEGGSTLERLLGKRVADSTGGEGPGRAALDDMLRAIVAPHITHAPGPEQARLLASVELALSSELRRVLHEPAFQRLEAAWRGLHWLARENPVGEDLQIWILDASRSQLEADLRAGEGDLTRSQLYRLVVDQHAAGPGGKPFAAIIGDLSFAGSEADVPLLAGLGALAAQAGGVFLAAAEAALVGASDLSRTPHRGDWSELDPVIAQRMALLRQSAVAPFIGLALPRVLGRAPYGKRSDPIERFDFSELASSDPGHEDFLWLNPAFACAQLIVRAFAQGGWNMELGTELELGDLPLATYGALGSCQELKPCAEVALDDASAERMLEHGLMPLISHRNLNAVRLLRVQSIASPPAALAGPWR